MRNGTAVTIASLLVRIRAGIRAGSLVRIRAGARSASIVALAVLVGACGASDVAMDSTVTTVTESGASNPTVALGADDGATYVAWVGVAGQRSNVFLARAVNGGLAAPVRVNDIDGDAAPHAQAPAQVATGPGGTVYVVWQNNTHIEGRRFPASDLRFARSVDGGLTFEPAIYVNDDAGGPPASHTFHDIAVAEDGTIYVSWIDGRAEAGARIRIARSSDGGRSFAMSRVVDDDVACPCCRTSLAVGPDGAVYVGWRKLYAGNVRDVVVARSVDGGRTFGEPVRVHDDEWMIDACPHAGPSLAVDDSGHLHVAWFTGAEGGAGAYYAVSTDGGLRFGAAHRLTPEGPVPTTQVGLAADGEGAVWIAWENPEGSVATLNIARVDGQAAPRRMDAGAPAGKLPAVAARNGRLAVAWLDNEAVRVLTRPR